MGLPGTLSEKPCNARSAVTIRTLDYMKAKEQEAVYAKALQDLANIKKFDIPELIKEPRIKSVTGRILGIGDFPDTKETGKLNLEPIEPQYR